MPDIGFRPPRPCIVSPIWLDSPPRIGAIFTLGDSTHYDDSELQALNPAMNAEGNSDFLILRRAPRSRAPPRPVPSTGTFSTAPASKDPGTAPFGPATDMALMAGTIIAQTADPPGLLQLQAWKFFYATKPAPIRWHPRPTRRPGRHGVASFLSNVTFSQYTSGSTN